MSTSRTRPRTTTVPSHTDLPASLAGIEIPLPGLDLIAPASLPSDAERRSRPYSATLPPTQAAIEAFWSRVVKAPGERCWFHLAAISGVDGYTRNRAELHLVGYSTAG